MSPEESDEKAGGAAPQIDDSSLVPPIYTEEEKDKLWVAAGLKLPRPKED
jgi:hypothetical protein